jgi:hypothetical protein
MWIGVLLCLGASSAYADTPDRTTGKALQPMRLGDSSWYLYRPIPRSPAIYDLDYMMERLRCDLPEYSLRFSDSLEFAFELKIAPLLNHNDFVGPVYGMDVGATQLVFSFNF